jgi:signal transduction histidine kinase
VLVVEDDPQVRSLLTEYVRDLGLEAEEAGDGVSALERARRSHPALMLLDVTMPHMGGKELLARLKADPQLQSVPVIVISGETETDVAVECIDLGADDFIPKPFQPTLLRARIRSSIERGRLQAAERSYRTRLETQHLELETRVQEATRELAEAHERLKALDLAKDGFLRLISHELRTPITGMVGASEALEGTDLEGELRSAAVEVLRTSVGRLQQIVEDALLLTTVRAHGGELTLAPRPLGPILKSASARVSGLAGRRGVAITPPEDCGEWVLCDQGLLVDAMAALAECAVKFSAEGESIRLRAHRSGASVYVRVDASGPGIPPDVLPRFFDMLSVPEPLIPGGDLGLGPAVAAEVVRLLGGSTGVESSERGVSFVVCLRAAEPTKAEA